MIFEIKKYSGFWILDSGFAVLILFLLLSSCTSTQVRDGTAINSIPAEIRQNLTVSGTISVKGEIKVFPGAILTVKPGTRFLFEPFDPDNDGVNDSRLVIEGVLVARGEPDAPIYFSSAAPEPEPGDWLELRMDHSEGSVLEYCVLEHSRYGLHVHFSSGVLANSIIRSNIDGTRFGNSRFLVKGNSVAGNLGKGINLRQSKILVTDNILERNRHGIFLFEEGAGSSILRNRFALNGQSDIRFGDFYSGGPPQIMGNGKDDGSPLDIAGPTDLSPDDQKSLPPPDAGPGTFKVTLLPRWERDLGSMLDAHLLYLPGKKVVIAATWGGGLLQLDAEDGKILVSTHVNDVIDATPLYIPGSGQDPADRIFFTAWDLKARFTDASTGKVLKELPWEASNADDHQQGGPRSVGGGVYLGLWNGDFAAVEPSEMKWLWKTPLDGAVRSVPAYDGDNLWIGTDGGSLYSITTDGRIQRSMDLGITIRTTPSVLGRDDVALVTADGVLMRIREGDVKWRRKLPGAGTYASPLSFNVDGAKFILAADGSGAVSLFDPDGALYWRSELGSAVHMISRAGALVWAGTGDGRLAALSPLSGAVVGELRSRDAVHSRPVIVPGEGHTIFWAARDGVVRAHGLKMENREWEGPVQ
jgi:outer membrane protein assembly factor BamB